MNPNPLVTVLMPVYNGGEYLRLSMESILNQTYADFEFLLINDCSTDNSLETIQSFKDPRIKVHTNQKNMGQTKSLNVGLRLAKGKYVVINDADDLSLPQRIEKQLPYIQSHPEYVVVGGSSFIMDRAGKICRTFIRPIDQREILLMILCKTPLIHGSVIMNKEIILSQGGYNEDFRISQDKELWSSLIRKGLKVANIPDILVVIRHYSVSTSFKEKDTQTIDNGKTLQANIEALTTLKVTINEATRQRMFFFAPEQLEENAFYEAEDFFVKQHKNLNERISFAPRFIEESLKRRLIKPFTKFALFQIESGRYREARRILSRYLRRYGFARLPFMLWLISQTHLLSSRKIVVYYNVIQGLEAKLHTFNMLMKKRKTV